MSAPKPSDDATRPVALHALAVLNTGPEVGFDSLVRVVKGLFDVDTALVSLVDADRQWPKARLGLTATETPRDIAFCAHAILSDEVLWVEDARADARFCADPLVTGAPHLRFYAGAPIRMPSGARVGTVCVLHPEPRAFDARLAEQLTNVASLAADRLELRRLQNLQHMSEQIADTTSDAFIGADAQQRIVFWNSAATRMFGRSAEEALGQSLSIIVPEPLRAAHEAGFARLVATNHAQLIGRTVEVPGQHADGSTFTTELSLCSWGEGAKRWVGAIVRDVSERKLRDQQLRETQTLLDAVVEHVPATLLVKDARDGRFVFANRAAEQLIGADRGQIIGKSDYDLLPAEEADLFARLDREVLNAGEIRVFDDALTANGQQRLLRTTKAPMRDASGALTHLLLVCEDVTDVRRQSERLVRAEAERQRAEHESAAARQVMSAMVRIAPTPLVMTDAELRVVDVSAAWSELYGRSLSDVVGRTMHELFPAGEASWDPVYKRCLDGAAERGAAAERSVAGPVWFEWTITPWRDADGRVGGLLLMNFDVTRTMTSLRATERAEKRLLQALDVANLVAWQADCRTGALECSGPAEALFGRQLRYDDLTTRFADLVRADHATGPASDSDLDGLRSFSGEWRVRRDDGQEVWIHCRTEVFTNEAGVVERAIGVIQDVTESKRLQLLMTQARDAAENASRTKSEFLANMSHEIRTPLNGVIGVADVLSGTALDAHQRGMVELIVASGAALDRLVGDVLDVSSIEAGRLKLVEETFDLEATVRAAAAVLAFQAGEKGISLSVDVASDARLQVHGDSARLGQILVNLLGNAVKFTPAGSVRLTARGAGPDRFVFTVADTGIGFDAGTAARLFERFEQADGSDTRKYGGSGLGLAIASGLAEAMGGEITAESAPGLGSTFTLSLPLKIDVAENPDNVAAADAHSLATAPLRVLVADDNANNRQVVSLILGAVEATLVDVSDGAEAVTRAAHERFDLILMDVQMPVMDGLTAIRAIRADELDRQRPRTPVLVLSANATPAHRSASVAAGADRHIAKPITAPGLLSVVSELLTDHKAMAAA